MNIEKVIRIVHRIITVCTAIVGILWLIGILGGCATVLPNAIPVELTHVSHATQHFGPNPTNFGYNELSAGLKWTPAPGLSVKVEEGVVLDRTTYYDTRDNGRQPMQGDLLGPREVFMATISYEFRLK